MSQKLTLAVYLEGRGAVKSLTKIEAEAFGVPYPLVSGWPARYREVEITNAMLEDLTTRVTGARRSTASKARRGLQGVEQGTRYVVTPDKPPQASTAALEEKKVSKAVNGFVVRKARRYCGRQLALRA
jgi:hypothetical protein